MANIATGGFLKGKKTYITAGLSILAAIGGYLTGDMAIADMVQTIVTSVLAATVRHGIG